MLGSPLTPPPTLRCTKALHPPHRARKPYPSHLLTSPPPPSPPPQQVAASELEISRRSNRPIWSGGDSAPTPRRGTRPFCGRGNQSAGDVYRTLSPFYTILWGLSTRRPRKQQSAGDAGDKDCGLSLPRGHYLVTDWFWAPEIHPPGGGDTAQVRPQERPWPRSSSEGGYSLPDSCIVMRTIAVDNLETF